VPLVVCATPIGNLEDVTLRVLAELRAADVVLCEDTRHTRGLLERHGIEARLLSYHEQTRPRVRPSCCRGWRRASAWRSSPMQACPACRTRGARIVARRARRRRRGGRCFRGPSAVETALVRFGPRGRSLTVRRVSAAGCEGADSSWEELGSWHWARGRVRVTAPAPGDAALARGCGRGAAGCGVP